MFPQPPVTYLLNREVKNGQVCKLLRLKLGTSPERNARAIYQKEKQTFTTELTMLITMGIVLLPRPVCHFFPQFRQLKLTESASVTSNSSNKLKKKRATICDAIINNNLSCLFSLRCSGGVKHNMASLYDYTHFVNMLFCPKALWLCIIVQMCILISHSPSVSAKK